jgi:hypothetical protein
MEVSVELLIATVFTSPMVGGLLGFSLAFGLLSLLSASSAYAGFYYSVPRMLLKWLSRRSLRAL